MANRSLGTLTLDLVAKLGGWTPGLDKAGRDAEKFAARQKKAAKDIENDWKNVGNAIRAGFAGITIGATIAKFVQESRDAQNEQAQLAAALRSTGNAAGYTQDQLNQMAETMANSSIFSDGEINAAQARLLSYTGIVGEQFPQALQAALDMSARLGVSLEQSAETIGRALDVPSQGLNALSRQGFRFTEDQKRLVEQLEATGRASEAQAIVLDAVKNAYGGAAEAARNTFGGALIGLQNQLNALMTGDDGSLNGAAAEINNLTKQLGSEETKQAFATLTAAIARLIGLLAQGTGAFVKFGEGIGNFFGRALNGPILDVDRQIKQLELQAKQTATSLELAFKSKAGNRDSVISNLEAQAKRTNDELIKLRKERDSFAGGTATASTPIVPNVPNQDRQFFEKYIADRKSNAQQLKQALETEELAFKAATRNLVKGSEEYIQAQTAFNTKVAELRKQFRNPREAKVAESEFEKYIKNLQKEIIQVSELTRVEKVLAEVQSGRLGKITALQQARLVALAEEADGIAFVNEVMAINTRIEEEGLNNAQNRLVANQQLANTYRELLDPTIAIRREMQIIDDLVTDGFLTPDEGIATQVEVLKDKYKELGEEVMTFDMFAQNAARNIQEQLGSNLADILNGEFKNIGDSFLRMINRMAAEAVAADLARKLFGQTATGKGSDGGGWLGGIIDWAGKIWSGFAEGGYTGAGGKYQPAGVVHAGEYVINAKSTRQLGLPFLNNLNGFANGGYVGQPMGGNMGSNQRPIIVQNSFPANTDRRTIQQAAVETGQAVNRSLARNS